MSDDLIKTPGFQDTRRKLLDSQASAATWSSVSGGSAGLALVLLLTDFIPVVNAVAIPLTLAAGAVAIYAGHKAAAAKREVVLAKEDIAAQRAAYFVGQERANRPTIDMTPDLTETKFQDMLAARVGQARAQGRIS